MTYKGRKFDIRVWTILTADFRIFIYKQGYLRTTSTIYEVDSKSIFVHLTNQCMQTKNKEEYGKFEEGNTLSFDAL